MIALEKRNVSIQLLRVGACLLVFLVHFGQRVDLSGILRVFTDFGRYGVQLFLLISGFLAGRTFFDNPEVNVWTYYKKRAIAILPLYYLVILYYFITENILNHFVSVIPADELGLGWFRYIFLLNGFFNSDTYFWSNLGITWTIPIFAFFYLIAPWILRKVKSVAASIVVWLCVFAITKVLGMFYSCVMFSNLHMLFLGAVVYACVKNKCSLPAIAVFALLAICMTILKKELYVYISSFACIMLALTTAGNVCLPGWLQRTIDTLDKYSYTLYLMHGVVFCSVIDRLNLMGVSRAIIAAIAVIGTFVATLIVGKFIEKPIQNLLKKRILK